MMWLLQGHRVYYHRIVVESDGEKDTILVKCGWMPHHGSKNSRAKRDELSADFREDE